MHWAKAILLATLVLAGCAHYVGPCDNPRNMACMSPTEVAHELGTRL